MHHRIRSCSHTPGGRTVLQILTMLLSGAIAAVWTQAEPLLLFFGQACLVSCSVGGSGLGMASTTWHLRRV